MADQPFDYSIKAQNPVDAMFGGMKFGQEQRQGEQQMALANSQEQRAQTQFGQENIMFDQAQQDRATALKAAMEAKAAAAKLQTDLVGLAGKVATGTATHADFTAISLAHPELTNEMKTMWDGQTAERKAADVANLYKVSAALKAGKPDIAIKMFEDRAEAADAAGDKQEADISRAMAAGIKADPAAGLATLGLLLQSVDDKASIELFGEPKFNADRYKVVNDQLVDIGDPGGPKPVDLGGPPPKVDFKDLSDLRKEWIGMPAVKTFQTQSDSFGRIMAASDQPSGAGDVALVYSYMKMLDPGSVVREGEFATAEQTGGLDQRLVGTYNKLVSGERLTEEMRADFLDRAQKIYGNAEAEYKGLRKQYEGIAKRNGFPVEDALPDFSYAGKRGADGSGSQVAPTAGAAPAKTADELIDEINGL